LAVLDRLVKRWRKRVQHTATTEIQLLALELVGQQLKMWTPSPRFERVAGVDELLGEATGVARTLGRAAAMAVRSENLTILAV
jgi:hypothetical protein